jgi:hypothetical protein
MRATTPNGAHQRGDLAGRCQEAGHGVLRSIRCFQALASWLPQSSQDPAHGQKKHEQAAPDHQPQVRDPYLAGNRHQDEFQGHQFVMRRAAIMQPSIRAL